MKYIALLIILRLERLFSVQLPALIDQTKFVFHDVVIESRLALVLIFRLAAIRVCLRRRN